MLTLLGARMLRRPVLWVCERTESFAADFHARDNDTKVTLGLDKDGTFVALAVETIANIGAYISPKGLHSPDQQSRRARRASIARRRSMRA